MTDTPSRWREYVEKNHIWEIEEMATYLNALEDCAEALNMASVDDDNSCLFCGSNPHDPDCYIGRALAAWKEARGE